MPPVVVQWVSSWLSALASSIRAVVGPIVAVVVTAAVSAFIWGKEHTSDSDSDPDPDCVLVKVAVLLINQTLQHSHGIHVIIKSDNVLKVWILMLHCFGLGVRPSPSPTASAIRFQLFSTYRID